MELCPALDVLYDEGVRAFLSRELYRYVDREAFDKLEMPAGCGYDEMWELLGAVRNVVGVHLLSDLSNVIDYGELWYVCTPEMSEALAGIAGLSSEVSHVARVLARQPERVFGSGTFVEELCAVLRRDGMEVDRDVVANIVCGNRAPDGPVDMLLHNAIAILKRLVDCSNPMERADVAETFGMSPIEGVPTAVRSLHELFDLLDAGVGPCDCAGRRKLAMPLFRSACSSETVLASVADMYLNWADKGVDPLVAYVSNADALWEYAPFPRWNSMMELLVRAAFFAYIGRLGVAFSPFCSLALRWERGELSAEDAPCRIEETALKCGLGVDVTLFYAQKVRLLARGVRELDAVLTAEERRNVRLREAAALDARLNHRQRDVLAEFVENPEAEVDVRAHAAHHDVSLVTARNDLQKLVEFDYLYRRCAGNAGKTTVFSACPDLPAKLACLLGSAGR